METVLSKHSPPSSAFKGVSKEEEESLLGQIEIWKYMTQFTDSFALKAVVELRIADIIDRYGLNSKFNDLFNQGQASTARYMVGAVIAGYKDGFKQIQSLVDVGGGIGGSLSEIVRAYPHIQAINFDLPHVVSTAPKFDGITHVGGDMFVSVPSADAIYMKWILHDWSDDHCIKLLKNCRKAIPEKTGKVIIVDHVLDPEGDEPFTDLGVAFDMILLAHNAGGKERTEENWKYIFKESGFPRYNIIKINTFPSIIEAFPI
ncbi:unnamed protein product [Lathyrus sativus]|nr:unnamed protein product [Lathyrus sativus]